MLRTLVATSLLLSATASQAQTPPAPADTLRTPGGIRYVIHHPGTGKLPHPGGKVFMNYTGFFPSGKFFYSSVIDGGPVRVTLGSRLTVKGWEELLPLLPAGSRVWAYFPARLAYGKIGLRDPDDTHRYRVPPDTDVIYEVEIVKVN